MVYNTDGIRPIVKATQARMANAFGLQISDVLYLANGSEGHWNMLPHIASWIVLSIQECRKKFNVLNKQNHLKLFYNKLNLDTGTEIEPYAFRNALHYFIKEGLGIPLNQQIWPNNHGVIFDFAKWTIEVNFI